VLFRIIICINICKNAVCKDACFKVHISFSSERFDLTGDSLRRASTSAGMITIGDGVKAGTMGDGVKAATMGDGVKAATMGDGVNLGTMREGAGDATDGSLNGARGDDSVSVAAT
jgi:hypothetical protein